LNTTFHVERLTDPIPIRDFLNADRGRYAYIVGDLVEPYWSRAEFYGAFTDYAGGDLCAVLLIYRAFEPPPTISAGDTEGIAAIFAYLTQPDSTETFSTIFYHATPEHFPIVQRYFDTPDPMSMWRMTVTPERFRRDLPLDHAVRLTGVDAADAQAVFHSGLPGDLTPGNFDPASIQPDLLDSGIFYGVKVDGRLVAIAGTHIISAEGIGVVGYVFTSADARGKGYATVCTAAVTRDLLDRGLDLVALNVKQDNPAAVRAYEKIGYVRHSAMYEGTAQHRMKCV